LRLHESNRVIKEVTSKYDIDLIDLLKLEREEVTQGIEYTGTFQVKEFVLPFRQEIRGHFSLSESRVSSQDFFVHLRLGDAAHVNPGIEYYERAIARVAKSGQGFISSDSPHSSITQQLVNSYNLTFVEMPPMQLLNFARQFQNLVLSNGTFSWWMGFLSNSQNIAYPVGMPAWHGDIFVFDEWTPTRIK
jgi:hypothetical protein